MEIPKEAFLLINLLNDMVKNENSTVYADDIDFEKLFEIAKNHSVAATVFLKLDKSKFPPEIYNEWYKHYAYCLRKMMLFNTERKNILSHFEEAKIDYCLIKGPKLQELYPTVREFADNDILVRMKDGTTAHNIMKSLGYQGEMERVHYEYFKDNLYHYEVHTALFDETIFDYEYYDNAFDRMNKISDFEYVMTDEDFFVYVTAHFSKHYEIVGSGLRSFADYYLLLNKIYAKDGFDVEYAEKCLKEIKLYDFYVKVKDITEKMFDGRVSEIDKNDMKYLFLSNTYGSKEFSKRNKDLKLAKQSKFLFILKRLFPSFQLLSDRYLILKKVPILAPIFWVVRIITFAFDRKEQKRTLKMFKEDEEI